MRRQERKISASASPGARRGRRGARITTFAKLAIAYCMLETATFGAYLVTGEIPPLGHAFIEQPVLFGTYVALLVVAAIFGNRAHSRIAGIGRYGLSDTPGGDRLAVFYPAVRVLSDPIRYTNRHPRYLSRLALLVIGVSALVWLRIGFFPDSIPPGAGRTLEIGALLVFPLYCWILLFHEYYRGYLFQVRYLRRLHDRQQLAERAIHDAEILRIKNKEQEEIMALVAHKFRGSLDRMMYNIEHDNSAWVHREAVSTMRGLLDIFGLISTDTALLHRRIAEDKGGPETLAGVAARSLGLALSQLLSTRGSERIQQHFLAYARRHRLVEDATSLRVWHEEHGALAERLRSDWQRALMELLPEASPAHIRQWVSERFFALECAGLDESPMRFAPYGTTGSLLTILITEAFTNLFKYYASAGNAPVRTRAAFEDGMLALDFINPTTPSASAMVKGSGRGHDFIALLVEKLEGSAAFQCRAPDLFVLEIRLPAHLFAQGSEL